MACSIDNTVGGAAANSYASIVEADAYHDTHVDGATWTAFSPDQKCRALQQATRELDAYISWQGWAVATTQKLAWPRYGLLDPATLFAVPGTIIPDRVKWATAEQARQIAVRNREIERSSVTDGIQSVSAGSVDIEFVKTSVGDTGVGQVIAPAALQYIAAWGQSVQAGKGGPVHLMRV